MTADLAAAVSSPGASLRGGLGAGYAYVPPPFESPWGYELTARLGLGDVPGGSQVAVHTGGRAALLFRPGQSDTVWHQDRVPTGVLWYIAPFLSVDPTVATTWHNPWVDAVAGIGLYALHYDIGAP
jgi:hypothetical protein